VTGTARAAETEAPQITDAAAAIFETRFIETNSLSFSGVLP
jgi:hypothetical protein